MSIHKKLSELLGFNANDVHNREQSARATNHLYHSRLGYRGSIGTGVAATAAIGAFAGLVLITGIIVGGYVGYASGWFAGSLFNALPYLKDAIPCAAKALGMNPSSNVTVKVFEAAGTLTGAGFGFHTAFELTKELNSDDDKKDEKTQPSGDDDSFYPASYSRKPPGNTYTGALAAERELEGIYN